MNEWRKQAECKGTSSDLFFPTPRLSPDESYRIDQIALEICKMCEVQEECLEYAITNPALVLLGTWGGKTFKQLKGARRRRDATNLGCDRVQNTRSRESERTSHNTDDSLYDNSNGNTTYTEV